MKRFVLPVLLSLFVLLLSGCGGAAAADARDELSHRLSENPQLFFTADLRAEYANRSCAFTLEFERGAEEAVVTIEKPELIAGVCARVRNGGTEIEYDGVRLDVGELNSYGLSPMSALPLLVNAMQKGHMDAWWEEDGKLAFSLVTDDHLSTTLYLDKETITPLRAELVSDGRVLVFCDINDWKYG